MSELRRDPVTGTWVVISPARAGRPHDFSRDLQEAGDPSTCPFCPGHEHLTPPTKYEAALPGAASWTVRVIDNKFPAVSAPDDVPAPDDLDAPCPYRGESGFGGHEVIVETPDHAQGLAGYSPAHARLVVDALIARLDAWREDGRVAQAVLFRNWGKAAGASLSHAHTQLITLARIPELVTREVGNFVDHEGGHGGCLLCDVWEADAPRTVFEQGDFIVQVPYAAPVPYALRVVPRTCAPSPLGLTGEHRDDLARTLVKVAATLRAAFGDPPFNLAVHIAPYPSLRAPGLPYHWHLSVIPRTAIFAGFEWGSGYRLNPVDPDVAAATLREAADGLSSEVVAAGGAERTPGGSPR